MSDFIRYGIYFLPEGDLADFGARWLGWDIRTGTAVPQPDLPALGPRLTELTDRPRKYGFHATLKPPFWLTGGQSEAALVEALSDLASRQPPVRIERLAPGRLGRFIALLPEGAADEVNALAAACVRDLDLFRAAPDETELARRRASALTPAQEAHLARWGYPHVMESFHFHMTLTGRVGPEVAAAVEAALAEALPALPEPFPVEAIALVGEGRDGMFREIHRAPLTGPSS